MLTEDAERSEIFVQIAHAVGANELRKRAALIRKSMQPMLDRLATLQEPELALMTAMLTRQKNVIEIWAKALGWKFESPVHETPQ